MARPIEIIQEFVAAFGLARSRRREPVEGYPLVAPRAGDLLGRADHLTFGQREIAGAPDAHGRRLNRRQNEGGADVRLDSGFTFAR